MGDKTPLFINKLLVKLLKNMSPTFVSSAVIIIVSVLKLLGIEVGSEQLTTTIETLVAIVGGIIILVRRYKKGDVSVLGIVK